MLVNKHMRLSESAREPVVVEQPSVEQKFFKDVSLKDSQNRTLKTRERNLEKREGPMDYQGAFIISLRTTSEWEMSEQTPKEVTGHLQQRKRSCDDLPDEIAVSSATVKRQKGLPVKTRWQPSLAGPSATSASRREPPLELAPAGLTAWGLNLGQAGGSQTWR